MPKTPMRGGSSIAGLVVPHCQELAGGGLLAVCPWAARASRPRRGPYGLGLRASGVRLARVAGALCAWPPGGQPLWPPRRVRGTRVAVSSTWSCEPVVVRSKMRRASARLKRARQSHSARVLREQLEEPEKKKPLRWADLKNDHNENEEGEEEGAQGG